MVKKDLKLEVFYYLRCFFLESVFFFVWDLLSDFELLLVCSRKSSLRRWGFVELRKEATDKWLRLDEVSLRAGCGDLSANLAFNSRMPSKRIQSSFNSTKSSWIQLPEAKARPSMSQSWITAVHYQLTGPPWFPGFGFQQVRCSTTLE